MKEPAQPLPPARPRFKPYQAYKDSGVECLGEIPVGWEVKRLKRLAVLNPEALLEDTDPTLEMVYVDIGGVDSLGRVNERERLTFATAPSRARRLVRDGDVIVSTVRTYLRAIAPVRAPEPGMIVSTGFAVVRPTDDLTTEYAAYALRAPYFVERVVANSKGVSFPAINESEMATYEIAVPSEPEQRAIAAFLDRETTKIDALVAKKERLIELLQEQRTALITRAVTKGLDPHAAVSDTGSVVFPQIPGGWELRKLRRLMMRVARPVIPIFTAELKNLLNGQDVEDAIRQYKTDRDPREPLLAYGRCLAHFAVDPDLVYVTTQLAGPRTRFLPFNKGKFGGAGNPPVPPTRTGYATGYLWEETWARDSVLDLVRQFIHEVEEEDEKGKKTGRRFLIFPRYQQLDCVRSLVTDARAMGAGQRYLIQHSAGSGKSFTIAWLAHQLATLHGAGERRVFDSIVVITDRRVLDRQLQTTMRQFEQTLGVVENIDTTSRQLKEALESGKTIIVTTLQKFPVIAKEIGELPGKRFALIVDEAHSSQSGESTKSLKAVLSSASLEEAESEEAKAQTPEEELESTVLAEMEKRGRLPNLSTFAFTATPKPKTLELFGAKRPDGAFAPFHLYSMRQAIEEGFILDVLANYATYKAYWRLLKKVEDDPRYDRRKAEYLLKSFVELHPHAIGEKARTMIEHFAAKVQGEIGGKAKAMIVTRSRLHAVRYKLSVDKYLVERGHPFKALVAFSGTVQDGGQSYTESNMNGFPETQTAKSFERPEYRFLIVANKFQTGFDQLLLHTMYVDKKLGGVNAVQTLSRLNRTHPEKKGTMVLDFANESDEIKAAFEPYYETTLLSEATDPNLLYEIQARLAAFPVYAEPDVDGFAKVYFDPKAAQDRLYAVLAPIVERFVALSKGEKHDFRSQLTDYVRLYAFLSQVLTFADADLEKLYVFARYLRRLLPADRAELPREVQQNIDMESYRIQQTGSGKIALERKPGTLDPFGTKGGRTTAPEELETLSLIIAELNERFGLNLGPEHRVTLNQMMGKLDDDAALDAAARVNTRENVRLTFDQKVEHVIQEIVDSNFDLYKRITDDRAFGEAIKNFLFDQYLRAHRNAEELIKRGESKTLEFKSTLRWSVKENRQDDKGVTHAVLKTIAAFLNTEGGDLLIGVADDGAIVGIEKDQLETDDKFMRHLSQVVRNGLGDRAGTCIDPRTQIVQGKTVCVVSCQRSPEPVFLKWKGMEAILEGDFFVRSGPGTVKLPPDSAREYIRTRFPGFTRPSKPDASSKAGV